MGKCNPGTCWAPASSPIPMTCLHPKSSKAEVTLRRIYTKLVQYILETEDRCWIVGSVFHTVEVCCWKCSVISICWSPSNHYKANYGTLEKALVTSFSCSLPRPQSFSCLREQFVDNMFAFLTKLKWYSPREQGKFHEVLAESLNPGTVSSVIVEQDYSLEDLVKQQNNVEKRNRASYFSFSSSPVSLLHVKKESGGQVLGQ